MKQAKTTSNIDYSGDLAKVSIEILGDDFDAKLLNTYGTQSTPPAGTPCLVVAVGNNDFNKYIIPLQIGLEQIDDGEYQIGNFDKSATVHFKADGTVTIDGSNVEINGNDKRFVTYAELNSALQTFVTSLNSALALKLDGVGSPGTTSIDISASETQTVKTGG